MADDGTRVYVQQAPSNGLGTAGFVVSLVGLVTCGLLCPLGFILSLCGLGKEPKGLAIAGTVIGLIGSGWFILFGFVMVVGFLGLGAAIGSGHLETGITLNEVRQRVVQYRSEHGDFPDELQFQTSVGTRNDAWKHPIVYRRTNQGFELRSTGPDGLPGNDDDMVVNQSDD